MSITKIAIGAHMVWILEYQVGGLLFILTAKRVLLWALQLAKEDYKKSTAEISLK